MKLIDKSAVVAEIERVKEFYENIQKLKPVYESNIKDCNDLLSFIDTLEVKKVNVSLISENLAVAHEYLDYTSTGNLAHNKPMVNARLKWAIKGLFDAGLFELTHDKKYRMKSLGLKAQKGE